MPVFSPWNAACCASSGTHMTAWTMEMQVGGVCRKWKVKGRGWEVRWSHEGWWWCLGGVASGVEVEGEMKD